MSKEFNYSEVQEGVSDYIKELLESVPDDLRSSMAETIVFHTMNYGSYNAYEAVGIIECAKINYLETFEKVMSEENED